MKNIAASLTKQQVINSVRLLLGERDAFPCKSETRRLGWLDAKAGDLQCVVEKGQGLKPGEKLDRLALVRVTKVHREELRRIGLANVLAEGFNTVADFGRVSPTGEEWHERLGWNTPSPRETYATPAHFIDFFCATHRGSKGSRTTRDTMVTVIKWEYLGNGEAAEVARQWLDEGFEFAWAHHDRELKLTASEFRCQPKVKSAPPVSLAITSRYLRPDGSIYKPMTYGP